MKKYLILIFSLVLPLIMGGASLYAKGVAGGEEKVTLSDEKGEQGTLYHIIGTFDVEAPREQVWGVLTDYSALKGVVSSMQASCVISREGSTVVVDQVAQGKFLFFRKSIRLLLKIEEEPQNRLAFVETTGKPFRVYFGSWNLEDKGAGVEVTYHLNVSRADMAPLFIERGLFQDNALSLLKELKAEIVKRASAQAKGKTKKIPS